MIEKYDTIKSPASAEDILNIFEDNHRHQCQFDPEADSDIHITFDTTIEQWRWACDLVGWEKLGIALNEHFGIDFNLEKWKTLLEPASEKQLKELCVEISKNTQKEIIKPLNILGKTCLKGGIFLTIKSKLAEAGACVEELAPNTSLDS